MVEVAEDGVGVERGGRETAAGAGGGGGCWEDTWDEGGTTPPTPWGEAVEARCRGDDSPPATTKKTHKGPREHERVNCLDGLDGDRETFFLFSFFRGGVGGGEGRGREEEEKTPGGVSVTVHDNLDCCSI